jgi:acetyl esterase/lipase
MRRLRLVLAGTVTLALLAGLSGAVAAQASETTDEAMWPQVERSLVYGADDPEKQIIHAYRLEPREAPRPAVVWFHGGALVIGSPDDDANEVPFFTDRGYVTFMAGYRLFDPETGTDPWPAQIDDAQHVIKWIRAHAAEFNVDPDRICAAGHSSGGQLAGLLGTTEAADVSDPELAGISSRVNCVVSLSGDADILVPYDHPEYDFGGLWEMLLGATLDEQPALWEAASPAHRVDDETVPFLIIHGAQDEFTPVEMARNLADALTEAGRDVVYSEVGDLDHSGTLWHQLSWELMDGFLAYHLYPER